MALPFTDCLKEARSIPCYNGISEYSLSNFLRDMEMVLSWTEENYRPVIQKVLCNKLRGKALHCVESLIEPTFDEIIDKLKEEFGIKKSYFTLRNEAMNIVPSSIEDLHSKLGIVLQQMNTKFNLEGGVEILYMPENNEKLVFDVYTNFLPCHIKTLLIQNKICSINKAHSYFLENNLLNDVILNNSQIGRVVRSQTALENREKKQVFKNFKNTNNSAPFSNGIFRSGSENNSNKAFADNQYNNLVGIELLQITFRVITMSLSMDVQEILDSLAITVIHLETTIILDNNHNNNIHPLNLWK